MVRFAIIPYPDSGYQVQMFGCGFYLEWDEDTVESAQASVIAIKTATVMVDPPPEWFEMEDDSEEEKPGG